MRLARRSNAFLWKTVADAQAFLDGYTPQRVGAISVVKPMTLILAELWAAILS